MSLSGLEFSETAVATATMTVLSGTQPVFAQVAAISGGDVQTSNNILTDALSAMTAPIITSISQSSLFEHALDLQVTTGDVVRELLARAGERVEVAAGLERAVDLQRVVSGAEHDVDDLDRRQRAVRREDAVRVEADRAVADPAGVLAGLAERGRPVRVEQERGSKPAPMFRPVSAVDVRLPLRSSMLPSP